MTTDTRDTIWKDIPEYEGHYQISTKGEVHSLDRIVPRKDGKINRITGRILKPKRHRNGYYFVELSKNDKRKNYYIHRLVASAFLLKNNGHDQVNHLNGNKRDNRPENLEWTNALGNQKHARDAGLIGPKQLFQRHYRPMRDTASGFWFPSVKIAAAWYYIPYGKLKSQIRRGRCQFPLVDFTQSA